MPTANTNQKCDAPSNVDRAGQAFEEYGDFIRSVIGFYVKNETEAEDLFQDLFLSLISKSMPEEVQDVKAFLYKVISDMVKDAFRRIDRYQAKIRRYAKHNAATIEDCPENVLMEVEETKKMFELIERRLPPKEALAVTLRYRDNRDTGEVAKQMRVKPRSVSRYVSVGLRKVRCFFGEKQGDDL